MIDSVSADDIFDWIRREPMRALLVAGGAYLLVLLPLIYVLFSHIRLKRRQARLWKSVDGESLERMLQEHLDEARALNAQVERVSESGSANATALRNCLQRVGVVRYDAFPDVGGQQSFSVALLDAEGNGLVLSSLHSRHDVRVYAKPVAAFASPITLSDEEREAISQSRAGGPSLPPSDGDGSEPRRRTAFARRA